MTNDVSSWEFPGKRVFRLAESMERLLCHEVLEMQQSKASAEPEVDPKACMPPFVA